MGAYGRLLAAGLASCLAACSCEGESGSFPHTGGTGGVGGWAVDCDGDGDGSFAPRCGGDDCDDEDAAINPHASESCDGRVDDDCDGFVDQGCACIPGETRVCYPPGVESFTRWVGVCADGHQRCGVDGTWGAKCEGAVVPGEEGSACDGVDQDCDGVADGELRNRCGACGSEGEEVCGNGLDDDCDGKFDEADLCRVHCGGVDPESPPQSLGCCVADPDTFSLVPVPMRHSRACVEWEGLPACESQARECVDLDGDPMTTCVKTCFASDNAETRCVCGRDDGGPEPVADPGCGFETPCVFEDCADRTRQPCYSGPPATLGVGVCRGGHSDCQVGPGGRRAWSACEGEVVPGLEECGNGLDDDCDGEIDEQDGRTGRRCVVGAACGPESEESCGNGLDDDCDGLVDEGCVPGQFRQTCYRGPAATRGIGACRDGEQEAINGRWGPCIGDVLPGPEVCGDDIDGDCNGLGGPGEPEDRGCPGPPGMETCNGVDDDGDGLADEGLANACGSCSGTCYQKRFERPADCEQRQDERCINVEAAGGDPETITLARDKRVAGWDHILYLQTRESALHAGWGKLVQVDADRGEVRWIAPTGGRQVSQVAVGLDGSVWVGHSSPYGPVGDPAWASDEETPLVHLDVRGNRLCKLVLPGRIGGVVADERGYVWVTTGYRYGDTVDPSNPLRHHLYKLHGTRVRNLRADGGPWPDGEPRCEVIDLVPGDPEDALDIGWPVNRIVLDGRGILWGLAQWVDPASRENGWILRLDTSTLDFEWIGTSGGRDLCVAVDHRPWTLDPYAARGGGLVRLDADGPYESGMKPYPSRFDHELVVPNTSTYLSTGFDTFEVLCSGSGLIVAMGDHPIEDPFWFDPASEAQGVLSIPSDVTPDTYLEHQGIAEDRNGFVWVPVWREGRDAPHSRDNPRLLRLDTRSFTWDTFPLPANLFLIAGASDDLAGAATIRRAASTGRYEAIFDAGWATVDWRSFDWAELVPAGASVEATLRFAATRSGLDSTSTVCAFAQPPANLETCAGADGNRYVSVELTLRPGEGGESPAVRDLTLGWTRP